MRRRAAIALVATLLTGAAVASAAPAPLPLSGTTERGQQWRLRAAEPSAVDTRPSSWCLELGWETGVVVDGDRYGGGLSTCGRRPARRLAGAAVIDCERGSVFVFGAARNRVRRIRLADRLGARHRPRFAALPPGSGFRGRSFVAVVDVRGLPARLTARRAGRRTLLRIGRRREVCRPHPGAPRGGKPFATFESPS